MRGLWSIGSALLLSCALVTACGSDGPDRGTGTTTAAGLGGTTSSTGTTPTGAGQGGGVASSGPIGQVSGGRYHTCLRTVGGAVYCWGQGAYGALGNDGSYRGVPTQTLIIDDAVDIQCGGRFSCARRQAGALYCWGEDQAGQLGGPSTTECGDAQIDSVCAPVPQVVADIADAAGVALGRNHSCARLGDGSLRCWGSNDEGQLGNTELHDQMTPAAVDGLGTVVQISAGDAHTCALVSSPGTVRCWGKNANAQVGTGAVTDREPAPSEVAGITDAVAVAAGGEHSCVLHAGGTVSCWGYNYFGQLGNGSRQPTRAAAPQPVEGLSGVTALALGRYHSCALHADGTISCWGYNSKGELGDGTSEDRTSPVRVLDIDDAWFIAAGSWHTCAIVASGAVLCWGDNLGGQLGIDGVNDHPNPTPVEVQQLPTE